MTVMLRTRQLFELKDIRAVRVVCRNCEGVVALPWNGKFPRLCPCCSHGWTHEDVEAEYELFKFARKVIDRDDPPARLVFEIDVPESPSRE